MMKFLAVILFFLFAVALSAQGTATEYDYRWIQASTVSFIVVSPDSASREIKVTPAEIRQDPNAVFKAAMRMVQSYERDGWTLYEVLMQPGTAFFMRKPKQ